MIRHNISNGNGLDEAGLAQLIRLSNQQLDLEIHVRDLVADLQRSVRQLRRVNERLSGLEAA